MKLIKRGNTFFISFFLSLTSLPTPFRYKERLLRLITPNCTHTHTHTMYDSSRRGFGPSQRPRLDTTQHSQQTGTNDPGGIQTRNSSYRAAAEIRLRYRGHVDGLEMEIKKEKTLKAFCI